MTHHAFVPRSVPAHVSISLHLADGSDDLLVRHVRLLRDCVALAQARWSFGVEAAAVLPNQLHLLCGFPDAEFGVRGAMRLIKSAFSRHIPGGEAVVWAETSDVIEIAQAVIPLRRTFIETAPVRAGLVKRAQDWPFSSAHKGTALASEMGIAVA